MDLTSLVQPPPPESARYLALAYARALGSPDPSTMNGAIVVPEEVCGFSKEEYSGGCNDFPDGIDATEERLSERIYKRRYIEHAERMAIYDAARNGVRTHGATLYCPWAPCMECARAIILAGFSRLVVHRQRMKVKHRSWVYEIHLAMAMLAESESVVVEQYSGPVDAEPILISGKPWSPRTGLFLTGEVPEYMLSSHARRSPGEIMACGKSLLEIQARNKGCVGEFRKAVLESTKDIGSATAYRYMQVAQAFGECSAAELAMFDVYALMSLASKKSNEVNIAEAVDLARSGKRVTKEIAQQLMSGCVVSRLWHRLLPETDRNITRKLLCNVIHRLPDADLKRVKKLLFRMKKERTAACVPPEMRGAANASAEKGEGNAEQPASELSAAPF